MSAMTEAGGLTLEEARELVASFGTQTQDQLDVARLIATVAIEEYGDFDPAQWEQFRTHGVWNDHTSVQSALAVIRMFAPLLEAMGPVIEEGERIVAEYGADRPDHQLQPLMIRMGAVKTLINTYRGRI